MIQSFYQTRTVTDDTMTAQIPNPSRTAHACTHEEFIKTGVTPSPVTEREVDNDRFDTFDRLFSKRLMRTCMHMYA